MVKKYQFTENLIPLFCKFLHNRFNFVAYDAVKRFWGYRIVKV